MAFSQKLPKVWDDFPCPFIQPQNPMSLHTSSSARFPRVPLCQPLQSCLIEHSYVYEVKKYPATKTACPGKGTEVEIKLSWIAFLMKIIIGQQNKNLAELCTMTALTADTEKVLQPHVTRTPHPFRAAILSPRSTAPRSSHSGLRTNTASFFPRQPVFSESNKKHQREPVYRPPS